MIEVHTDANNNINIDVETTQANASVNLLPTGGGVRSIGTTPLFGPQGPKGDRGETGVDGVSPTASVTQTLTGATLTVTDSQGTTTANLYNGEDGQAATINVGSVTTGAAGTSATVINSGTTSAAIFDFIIPRGDTGADGYSPTATVTKSGTTATITITDKNGTTTANVYDGSGGTWGSITGTLSNQTDLQSALNDKYDSSNPNGYTSNTGTVTSVNNVSPVSGNVTLSIPSDTNDLTNGAGYITGITSTDVTTALGYTPYDSSNPSGYTSNVGTVTSVNNVSPVDGNVTLTLPDPLPSQTGQSGKYLTTDGTNASWGTVDLSSLANTNLSNLTDTGNIAMANASMPSTTYETLTAGASGTVYTAPADGYVYFQNRPSTNGGGHAILLLDNNNNMVMSINQKTVAKAVISSVLPCAKLQKYEIYYDSGTDVALRFIYAQGAESEAN